MVREDAHLGKAFIGTLRFGEIVLDRPVCENIGNVSIGGVVAKFGVCSFGGVHGVMDFVDIGVFGRCDFSDKIIAVGVKDEFRVVVGLGSWLSIIGDRGTVVGAGVRVR